MEPPQSGMRLPSGMIRLVIVADNSHIVEAIRIGFQKSGEFNLLGHADGRRASARTILGPQPDVILLDEMDRCERAVQLIREIREQDQHVSVIALSVQMDPEWLTRLFDAGAVGAISKATHPVALATLVREPVNGHIVHSITRPRMTTGRPRPVVGGEALPLTRRELEILRFVASGSSNG